MGENLMLSVSIPISKGLESIIDLDDINLVIPYKWHAKASKGNWYAATRIGKEIVFMHNLISGRKSGLEVDHINQDGLDNRRSNLRHSTRSQNRVNVSIRKDNKSGYKGVSLYKKTGKWRAYIQKDKKWKQIGYFNTKEAAAIAYNNAAQELFGEFAWLNHI